MKKFFSFALFCFLLSGLSSCSSFGTEKDVFEVDLTLITNEVSKDSNKVTETLIMNGGKVSYTWVYEGHHPNEDFDRDKEANFNLNSEQVYSLLLYMKDKELLKNLEEIQPDEGMGNLVNLELNVKNGEEKTQIKIRGMSEVLNGNEKSGNISNMATVEAAQDFISTVKDLGGFYAN